MDSIAYQSDAEGHIVLRVRRIKGRLGPSCSRPRVPTGSSLLVDHPGRACTIPDRDRIDSAQRCRIVATSLSRVAYAASCVERILLPRKGGEGRGGGRKRRRNDDSLGIYMSTGKNESSIDEKAFSSRSRISITILFFFFFPPPLLNF